MLAVFSNTLSPLNWYNQPVDRDNGLLYGQEGAADHTARRNASWFQALSRTSGYSWLGKALNKAEDSLFLSSVAMDGRGMILLGLLTKVTLVHFSTSEFHGGVFYLATKDGKAIVQTRLLGTGIIVSNNTGLVRMVTLSNVDNFLCEYDNGRSGHYDGEVSGMKYIYFFCTLEIVGVQTV